MKSRRRIPHTCQYPARAEPCRACAAYGPGRNATHDPKVLEGISRFRAKPAVCNSLPLNFPGADAYTPEGKPVFTSLRSQEEAGKRYGLVMV